MLVVWSDSKKCVLLVEWIVPGEENTEDTHERKAKWYESLQGDCAEKLAMSRITRILWFPRTFNLFLSIPSFLLRCGTRPNNWGTQRDSNSLLQVCKSSLLTITLPEAPHHCMLVASTDWQTFSCSRILDWLSHLIFDFRILRFHIQF